MELETVIDCSEFEEILKSLFSKIELLDDFNDDIYKETAALTSAFRDNISTVVGRGDRSKRSILITVGFKEEFKNAVNNFRACQTDKE